jgi:hypothetical protein
VKTTTLRAALTACLAFGLTAVTALPAEAAAKKRTQSVGVKFTAVAARRRCDAGS